MPTSLDAPLRVLKRKFPVLGHHLEHGLKRCGLANSDLLLNYLDQMPHSTTRELRQAALIVWVYFYRSRFQSEAQRNGYWQRVGLWVQRTTVQSLMNQIWVLFQSGTTTGRNGVFRDIAGNNYEFTAQQQSGSCGPACLSILSERIPDLPLIDEHKAGCLIRGSQGGNAAHQVRPRFEHGADATYDADLIDVLERMNRKCVYNDTEEVKVFRDSILRVVWNSGTGHYVVVAGTIYAEGQMVHVILDPIYGMQYIYPNASYQPCENGNILSATVEASINVPPTVSKKPKKPSRRPAQTPPAHTWQRAETSEAGAQRNRNRSKRQAIRIP